MKLIKTINRENEIVKLYNQPLEGGVSVRMNDKQYWMVTIKKDFINTKIKRRINVKGNYSVSSKCCKNCKETKMTEYNFYSSTYSSDGYQSVCKQCVRETAKQYRQQLKNVA
jgi:hypothetical protein